MTTKEKQGFGLYFLLAFGLAWLCQVGGCMALLQKQNAVLYQLALVATMLCPLLAVLLVLTLRKTGCKLPQAAAAVRGDPEFRWQQRPGRRRPREGLLNRLLHRSMMYK